MEGNDDRSNEYDSVDINLGYHKTSTIWLEWFGLAYYHLVIDPKSLFQLMDSILFSGSIAKMNKQRCWELKRSID